jgi:hypothetical protein
MSKLNKETRKRIEADASKHSENWYGHDDVNKDYLEGALHEAGRAQELAEALEYALKYAEPKGLTHEEYTEAKKKIKEMRERLAKYKEVGNG